MTAPWVDAPARRRPWVFAGFLTAGVTTVMAYYLLPLFDPGRTSQDLLFTATAGTAAVAVLVGVALHRPASRMPWLLLAAGQASYAAGDALYFALGGDSPSLSDVFYLGMYLLFAAGLVVFVRRRTPGWDAPALLDAAVVAISAGVVWWVYIIPPMTWTQSQALDRAVQFAYPALDVLVLAVAMRLVLGVGARTVAFRWLVASLVFMLCADVLWSLMDAAGYYTDGNWVDAFYLVSYISLAAAAVHPSMRWLDRRAAAATPEVGRGRVVMLFAAPLIPVAVLFVQGIRHAPTDVTVLTTSATVLFVLVLARTLAMVAAQRQFALVDSLTGLHSFDVFAANLSLEGERATHWAGELGVLLVEVDNLDLIGKTYGHPARDLVLCESALRVGDCSRPGDLLARYGDARLAVLMAGTSLDEVATLAETMRDAVSRERVAIDDRLAVRVTVSIGIATMPAHTRTAAELPALADQALHAATRAGRNRTYACDGPVQPVATDGTGWQARWYVAGPPWPGVRLRRDTAQHTRGPAAARAGAWSHGKRRR
jgi:diguanylate cyclase (GGDEF)-like protein